MTDRNYFYIFILIFVLCAVAFGYFYGNLSNISNDENFIIGQKSFSSGDKTTALKNFEKVLEKTTPGTVAEGNVKLMIAASYGPADYEKAITLFKEVANEKKYASTTRSYAVQTMAEIYSGSSMPKMVFDYIFKDEPYKSFLVEGNSDASLLGLYEYATSIYPLGLSEIRIARIYAWKLNSKTGKEEALKIIDKTKKAMDSADRDIDRLTKERLPNTFFYIPQILTIKANTIYKLYQYDPSTVSSLVNPEKLYDDAVRTSKGNKNLEVYTRYQYAVYLSKKYGNSHKEKIINLLNPLYSSDVYIETALVRSLTAEKDNTSEAKENALRLTSIDSKFKDFLRKIGWSI